MAFGLHKLLGKEKRGKIKGVWRFNSKSPLLSPPVVCELHGGDDKAIILGTSEGKVYSLDTEGKVQWIFDAKEQVGKVESMFYDSEEANSIQSSPNIADINEDGKKEILFGTEMGIVYALDYEGKVIWKFKAGGSIRGGIAVKDINNDGMPEIIFGCGDKHIYLLDNKGDLVAKHEIGSEIDSTPLPVGDKIIFGTNEGEIFCINHEGHEFWKFKTNGKITAEAAVGMIYGDENPYIVIGSTDHYLYVLSHEGELEWKFKTEGAIYGKAVLKDIDNDKKLEIVFGSCDNNVYALKADGENLWSYETDFWIVAPVIVEDIDRDGKLEVIAGSYDHNIYILDAKGNYMLDYVPGLSGVMQQSGSYTEVLTSEPGKLNGKRIWQYESEGMIVGCAVIKETKNIIVSTKPGKIDNLKHE